MSPLHVPFFVRHRLAISAILLSCVMITLMWGHHLSVKYSAPQNVASAPLTAQG